MPLHKRNQVEQAIFRTLDAQASRINQLRFRMKRLLAVDRSRGRKTKSPNIGDRIYAFYSQEPPGSGFEVMFTDYEVFALLAGIMVLEHGLPQAAVVSVMRHARPALESVHAEVLLEDPATLFDAGAIAASAKPGMIATTTMHPVFLAFLKLTGSPKDGQKDAPPLVVCRSQNEVMSFIYEHSDHRPGATIFELARFMHTLAVNLAQTRAVKRGRRA